MTDNTARIQGCPQIMSQMFFGLLVGGVLIKHPERKLFLVHAYISRIVQAAAQYGCFRSMLGVLLGVHAPLPLRNDPQSITQ